MQYIDQALNLAIEATVLIYGIHMVISFGIFVMTHELEPADERASDVSDLLAIRAAPKPVSYDGFGIRQLKALASVQEIPNASRMRKAQLIEALAA